jgi:hypothetical protein
MVAPCITYDLTTQILRLRLFMFKVSACLEWGSLDVSRARLRANGRNSAVYELGLPGSDNVIEAPCSSLERSWRDLTAR